jgi:hypothetical protein
MEGVYEGKEGQHQLSSGLGIVTIDFKAFERMRYGRSTRPLSIFYLALIYFILIGGPFATRPDARSHLRKTGGSGANTNDTNPSRELA